MEALQKVLQSAPLASKNQAVKVSTRSTLWIRRVLACAVRMLRLKMTVGDLESRGQTMNPGLHGKWPLKWCIHVFYTRQ